MKTIRIKSLIVLMLLSFSISTIHAKTDIWDGITISKGFYGGTGTKADPYTIYTGTQFAYFLKQLDEGNTFAGQYISLKNDIDLNGYPNRNKILSKTGLRFDGNLDGEDHSLSPYFTPLNGHYYQTSSYGVLIAVYGTVHDIYFPNICDFASVKEGGEIYNCYFGMIDYCAIDNGGGTLSNSTCGYNVWNNYWKYGGAWGVFAGSSANQSNYNYNGSCRNCDFDAASFYNYAGWLVGNYNAQIIENCGDTITIEQHNSWAASHSSAETIYKSWPLTFSPTFTDYIIPVSFIDSCGLVNYGTVEYTAAANHELPVPSDRESTFLGWFCGNTRYDNTDILTSEIVLQARWEHDFIKQPTLADPIAVPQDKDFASLQWFHAYEHAHFYDSESIPSRIEVENDSTVLEFDYAVHGLSTYSGDNDYTGYVILDGVTLLQKYDGTITGHFKLTLNKGTHTLAFSHAELSNFNLYFEKPIEGETSSTLASEYLKKGNGLYYCKAVYGSDTITSDTLDCNMLVDYTITTGIESVKKERHTDIDLTPIYNLNGQRVEKYMKGIVIKNGKKSIFK